MGSGERGCRGEGQCKVIEGCEHQSELKARGQPSDMSVPLFDRFPLFRQSQHSRCAVEPRSAVVSRDPSAIGTHAALSNDPA
jgi:hypothetical protein